MKAMLLIRILAFLAITGGVGILLFFLMEALEKPWKIPGKK